MICRAPSKINLYLRVCGKLPNGYHEIETLFLPLNDPADKLEIRRSPSSSANAHRLRRAWAEGARTPQQS